MNTFDAALEVATGYESVGACLRGRGGRGLGEAGMGGRHACGRLRGRTLEDASSVTSTSTRSPGCLWQE